jgi:hypothetical protein
MTSTQLRLLKGKHRPTSFYPWNVANLDLSSWGSIPAIGANVVHVLTYHVEYTCNPNAYIYIVYVYIYILVTHIYTYIRTPRRYH